MRLRTKTVAAVLVAAVAGVVGVSAATATQPTRSVSAHAVRDSSAVRGVKRGLKLAFFSVGDNNTYLVAGIAGAQAAAKEYGASLHVFNGNFDGPTQLAQVMSAIAGGGYNGFILEPNNGPQLCTAVKAAIKAKIAIGITNVPACNASYDTPYPGTAIFVGGQSPQLYTQWFNQGFKSASGGQFGVLVGPPTEGNSVRAEQVMALVNPKYPKWKNAGGFQPTGYQASEALTETQDMLQANPGISLLFSDYSGQTPGAISAIDTAGDKGKVKIYDLGGDKEMFAAVADGTIASTAILLPYEEEERGVQAVVAKLSGLGALGGVKVGQYWNLDKDPRLHGLSPLVTKANLSQYAKYGIPEY
jgi:ribose transport system substrate-binding protein